MRANGAGQKRLTVNGLPTDSGPVFSPDGGQIAFHTNRDGNFEIYEMGPTARSRTTSPTTRRETSPPTGSRCGSGIGRMLGTAMDRRLKMYGLSEYLMALQEVEKARLAAARMARREGLPRQGERVFRVRLIY